MCIDLWMTRTVPGWPKCLGGGRSCCCPCPRPSSPKPAPGLAWQSPACFPPLPNAPLPSVACLQHEVSWQTEQFCLEQSLSSYVHLVYPGRSADCAGSPIDCSNWVLLQLYSFHFLYSAWCPPTRTHDMQHRGGGEYRLKFQVLALTHDIWQKTCHTWQRGATLKALPLLVFTKNCLMNIFTAPFTLK